MLLENWAICLTSFMVLTLEFIVVIFIIVSTQKNDINRKSLRN